MVRVRASRSATFGLSHVAIRVRDVERSKAFYRETFGARPTYDDGRHVDLVVPGSKGVLSLVASGRPRRARAGGGVLHFGFRLRAPGAIDAVVAAARAAGARSVRRGAFSRGHPYAYFRDPDGYEVEVWYE
ncbi:MAG: VOC family protein [Methanobacteriota archaeon]